MQASINQLAEILAERAGRQFDIPFREEMKAVVTYWRARLIVDSLNSRPKDRKFFTVWLEIPLVSANISEFPGFPDCPVLKTKCELPRSIRANSKLFDFVGKLNRFEIIPVLEPHQIIALMHSEYSGDKPRAALINRNIYVFGELNLPGIAVNMIPEDIEDYNKCCEECGNKCIADDDPYPVSADIHQRIIQAALSTELRIPAQSETKEAEVQIHGPR